MLTLEDIAEAKTLRVSGATWKALGKHFSCDPETIKIRIDEGYKARRRQKNRDAAAIRRAGLRSPHRKAIVFSCPGPRIIPISIIAERDRAMSYEIRDITAALMGDPLPGRSALDKKMGNANG